MKTAQDLIDEMDAIDDAGTGVANQDILQSHWDTLFGILGRLDENGKLVGLKKTVDSRGRIWFVEVGEDWEMHCIDPGGAVKADTIPVEGA